MNASSRKSLDTNKCDIIILTTKIDKSCINGNIRIYKIKESKEEIYNIYLGIIYSYTSYISIIKYSNIEISAVNYYILNHINKKLIYYNSNYDNIYNSVYNKSFLLNNPLNSINKNSFKSVLLSIPFNLSVQINKF